MSDEFRFSPRTNRAAEIRWRRWGAAALAEAAQSGRPVLLNVSAFWCHWCQTMDETTFSDPAVIELINDQLIAVRVDADREPHVQDRYIAGGWPTNAFLTPTGEVLWSGTYVDAAALREVASGVLAAWTGRRDELEHEIDRRRRALDAARRQKTGLGLVRRESADDVITVMRDTFDPRNGGFGDEPKFPMPEAIELLYATAQDDASSAIMADQTLDGMLAGELWDAAEGGFFRYAAAADWTAPRHEKLLDVNAGLLDAYSLGAVVRGRDDWRDTCERLVDWVDTTLADPDTGLWAGSQAADPVYFAADREGRRTMQPPPVDSTLYTTAVARWVGALARAGARLDKRLWIDRAATAFSTLLRTSASPNGGMFHYRTDSGPALDTLAIDTVETARAALQLAQATGNSAWIDEARRLARHLERAFWADDGGFWDRVSSDDDVGALRYRERPFELNALAASLLLDLVHVTGERNWRGLAERTLARVGPIAGRHGPAGATLALAIAEFYDAPPAIVIAVPAADATDVANSANPANSANSANSAKSASAAALRRAAGVLPIPRLRVWTVPAGHTAGPQRFPADGVPVAYLWTRRGCSAPITTAGHLADASAGLHA